MRRHEPASQRVQASRCVQSSCAAQGTESATSVPVAVREHVTGPRSSEKLQRSVTAIPPAPAHGY